MTDDTDTDILTAEEVDGWVQPAAAYGTRIILYKLSRPVTYHPELTFTHVAVSAVDVPYSGPEMYVFAANPTGKIIDWTELPGSFRGALDHQRALCGFIEHQRGVGEVTA